MHPNETHRQLASGQISHEIANELLDRYDYTNRPSWTHTPQGDTTMTTATILQNLDNGTITQAAALDLMLEHTSRAYAIGALLDARKQRNAYRDQLHDLEDEKPRTIMEGSVIVDLIDHAQKTGYLTKTGARSNLIAAGMDTETAEHHVKTILEIKNRDAERKNYLDDREMSPRWCTRCGDKTTAAELSRRAICTDCASAAVVENLTGLYTKAGPAYNRWRDAMLTWAYTLEDEAIIEEHSQETKPQDDLIDHDKLPGCDGMCLPYQDLEYTSRDGPQEPETETIPF